jgi:ABC-type sugar transport system permease subunit
MSPQHLSRDTKRFLWIGILPSALLYGLFVIWPAINALMYSFTRWDGLSTPVWIGIDNFVNLFRSGSDFVTAIGHNIYLTVVPGSIILTLALFFAWMIHLKVAGSTLFRVTFFFPNVIASVAVALLWVLLYSTTEMGPINNIRQALHLEKIPFLESARLLQSIVPMMVWSATGFYLVLFLAAMENIPADYYEAAHLDGASPTLQFIRITLPLMWDVLTTGIIFLIVGGLKFFDAVWVMENGRPSPATHTMSSLMYAKVFEEYNVGYGTAIAVLLFVLVLVVTRISMRLLKRERLEY